MVRNLVLKYRHALKKQNYIASGQANSHWFNFYPGKLQREYIDIYGDDFNLIIFGSENEERDFFVIPFSYVKNIFVESNLHKDADGKQRWQGSITKDTLNIKGHKVNVREYFANHSLLEKYVNIQQTDIDNTSRVEQAGEMAGPGSDDSPTGRHIVEVLRIDRDTKIIRELKQLYGNRCQICGRVIRSKSQHYSQAHHLKPLGAPHEGPDDKANILVLCPNHHLEFDIGAIAIDPKTSKIIHFDPKDEINGKDFSVRHQIAEQYIVYHYEMIFCR